MINKAWITSYHMRLVYFLITCLDYRMSQTNWSKSNLWIVICTVTSLFSCFITAYIVGNALDLTPILCSVCGFKPIANCTDETHIMYFLLLLFIHLYSAKLHKFLCALHYTVKWNKYLKYKIIKAYKHIRYIKW